MRPREGEPRIEFRDTGELIQWLKKEGFVFVAPDGRPELAQDTVPHWLQLFLAAPNTSPGVSAYPDGLTLGRASVYVSPEVGRELAELLRDENSSARKVSTWPIERAFVYLDISDFSKFQAGIQLLVIQALIRLSALAEHDITGRAEAKLCIGDGYIYVWDEAIGATRFAGYLAREIEAAVSLRKVPEFHFRMGVHVGPVRCFWDPGREGWNYIGHGINGGNRVLAAIGKQTDDVVFISGDVRSKILGSSWEPKIMPLLSNRGRKEDKHGIPWRVYELNHSVPL